MTERQQDQAEDEVQLPDDAVEDLEPTEDEAADVTGGIVQKAGGGNLKAD